MNLAEEKTEKTEKREESKAAAGTGFLAVVRIRGATGVRRKARVALKQIALTRRNHCVLLPSNKTNLGILFLVKDFVTWGEASPDLITLLEKRFGKRRVFRLHPPRKGFKGGIKTAFPKGALGYRGEKISELINSMLVQ